MGLEQRVERLESHFGSLDSAVRNLMKITDETHRIVLENQRENRLRFEQIAKRFEQQDSWFGQIAKRFDQQDRKIDILTEAMLAGFKRADEQHKEFKLECTERFEQVDKRFDQLELLIRQVLPNANN